MTTDGDDEALPRHVRVSAPAKVLLFGEHAVVYGCPSIAAALTDLRLSVAIDRLDAHGDEEASIVFSFDDIAMNGEATGNDPRHYYRLDTLREVIQDYHLDSAFVPAPSQSVLDRIEALVEHEDEAYARALRPCVFLCCAVLHSSSFWSGTRGSLEISVSAATLPIGAGLGSSAALCVALAGALAQFTPKVAVASADEMLNVINAFAFSAEVILHGSPSGVDNTVSAHGGALVFHKLPSPSFKRITCDLSQFRFLIVNTRVPRSTKEQVGNVRQRYTLDQADTQSKFDAIEGIVNEFIDTSEQGTLMETKLGQLMTSNHELLNSLGVGHTQIEEVVRVCGKKGLWTKLTGAGGGGCTVSLVPQTLSSGDITSLMHEIESHGWQSFLSSMGGAGFAVEAIS